MTTTITSVSGCTPNGMMVDPFWTKMVTRKIQLNATDCMLRLKSHTRFERTVTSVRSYL
ncbi:hypothetical protein KSB_10900 [Ktedonobacter robiniae]|uniref:Uncharacterized protein n=1 Tax=Ktedonobacter robiniae TaxID=2778365 RepID=A0ABQ3UJL9_9CHLR|nr:hypothetical protein KSB_10900 [Ktedonobacter robiniae]